MCEYHFNNRAKNKYPVQNRLAELNLNSSTLNLDPHKSSPACEFVHAESDITYFKNIKKLHLLMS